MNTERIEEALEVVDDPSHGSGLSWQYVAKTLAAALREALAERDETITVCHGVLWLDNNLHNYGSDAWRKYFKACVRDARRAAALAVSSPADEHERMEGFRRVHDDGRRRRSVLPPLADEAKP